MVIFKELKRFLDWGRDRGYAVIEVNPNTGKEICSLCYEEIKEMRIEDLSECYQVFVNGSLVESICQMNEEFGYEILVGVRYKGLIHPSKSLIEKSSVLALLDWVGTKKYEKH